jgi:hypothetical protein
MVRQGRRFTVCGLAALALAIAAAGCGGNGTGPDGTPIPEYVYPDRANPTKLLDIFTLSLERKDIIQYAACLDTCYTYTFMLVDWEIAGVIQERPYWGKAQDVDVMGRMLSNPRVGEITCRLDFVSVWIPVGENEFYSRCRLSLEVPITMDGIEPWVLTADWSYLDFTVGPGPGDPALWTIRSIVESPVIGTLAAAAVGTEPRTFGEIKALFR